MKEKCIVLFSGGLDSRLAIKIMQERGFEVIAIHFILPFGCSCLTKKIEDFCSENKVESKLFDCTREKLLKEYLQVLEEGKYGRGKGFNPCKDCKIFMLKKAGEYAEKNKIKIIATGEVIGQRPMSQTKKSLDLISQEVSSDNLKLLRPLIELGIHGRRREKQINLAKKFKIKYPNPAGGCVLCEKELKKRFEFLIQNNLLDKDTIKLVNVGRHFNLNGSWIILGRNQEENEILEKIPKGEKIIPEFIGPSALIINKFNSSLKSRVDEIIKSYSKKGSLEAREKFEKERL